MATNDRFDDLVSGWLADTAQPQLPDRVLAATFERTRTTRQHVGWRAIVRRFLVTRPGLALGGAVVVVIAFALAFNIWMDQPAVGGPVPSPSDDVRSSFLGTWFSTSDTDGGTQTMTVRVSAGGAVEIVVTDDIASVCSGTPSTMTGTGRIEGSTKLVIPSPIYACDDGSEPQALSGLPLQQQLRNLTYVLDPRTEVLTVGTGSVWTRVRGQVPSVSPTISDTIWPQSSIEEVRQAQALADAGDPAYTWQVDAQLAGDDYGKWERLSNGQVELVDRFLREKLGWEAYMQNAFVGGADYSLADQRFLRCAPGRTNPLYPPQPDSQPGGESCAPTLNGLTYESVSLDLVQPDHQGPSGIWVVSDWRPMTFAQADPAIAEAQATQRLEEFLAARIAGRGAEGFVDVYADWIGREVPLLYATTSGARYERSEFERVDGPRWPYGGSISFSVRLFADDGATVVEQEIDSHWDGGLSVGIAGGLALGGTTAENGQLVPLRFAQFDGEVTYSSPSQNSMVIEVDDRLDDRGVFGLIDFTDPAIFWSECARGPVPADAAAFAQAVTADPDFETTAPVAATVDGVQAVAIDVALSPAGSVCSAYRSDAHRWIHALEPGQRLRLFLVDLPDGMSVRTLAITVMGPVQHFDDVVAKATPIIDSIEFHPG